MNEIIFVSGQRGSGKSFWVKNYLQGLTRYVLFDTLGEYQGPRYMEIEAFLGACQKAGDGYFTAIYDPYSNESFPMFCRIALATPQIYVIIEEIDLFSTPWNTPVELQKLIKYGRHYGVNIVGVSRRPSETSRLFTSQATRFIVFLQREPRDIAYFRSIIGSWADQIPTLEPHAYLDVDFSKGISANPMREPVSPPK